MEYNWRLLKEPLLAWYIKEHRNLPWRNTNDPYHVWLSEIMLQQTRVEAVKDYYHRFLLECPDVEHLALLSEERLLKLWEGLGYYNRAVNLKKTAHIVVKEYNGEFPSDYNDLLSLPGIGEYTAGAISSICFGKPVPAVDGNVLRVMTRLSDWHVIIDDMKTKRQAKEYLTELYQEGDCGLLTQSLMELGAMVCIPNGTPKCSLCPLKDYCKAFQYKNFNELPLRKEKKKRKKVEKTVFILDVNGLYGIRKRPKNGLLANMWEFPNIDVKMTTEEALRYVSEQGLEPVDINKMIPYTHIFTHVEWNMTAYYISCTNKITNLEWVEAECFKNQYPLPTAFKVFL